MNNDMIEVKTTAGILRAYKSKDPGQPGIYVVLQPNGSDAEIDMSYVCVYEEPLYRTWDNERDEDVVIMTYGDCYQEDYTRKDIIRRADLVEALEIDNVEFQAKRQ